MMVHALRELSRLSLKLSLSVLLLLLQLLTIMAFPAKATTTEVLWVSYDEPLRTAECGDTIIRFTPHLDDSNGDTANWNTLDWNSVNWAAINWIGVSNWDMTVSDDSVTEDETTLIPVSEQESDESVATRQVFLPLVTK